MLMLNVGSLKAALTMSSKKDIRYYLNGVHICLVDGQGARIRATDGTVTFEDKALDLGLIENNFAITISNDIVKQALVKSGEQIKLDRHDATVWKLGDVLFTPIDGSKYPDFTKITPTDSLPFANYNFADLARAEAAMRTATGKKFAHYRLQHGSKVGLMYRENNQFPRCMIAVLNDNVAFKDN